MACTSLQPCSAETGSSIGTAFAAVLALMVGLASAPSQSQEIDYDRVIGRADQQRMLLEKMSKESILIALQVDAESHLKELKSAHALFNHIRVGLRQGNVTLGLPPTTNSGILDKLSLVDDLWPLFDNTVRKSVESGIVGRTEIDALAEISQPLREALDDTVEAYRAEAAKRQLHSLRFAVISTASQQRAMTQRMAKEFFLIAYGHEARKNKSRLKKSAALFARSLQALQKGDPEQKLIAPPSPSIRRQLEQVDSLWGQFKRLIGAAVTGDPPSQDEILKMSTLNAELLDALEETVSLYRAL